MHISMVLLLMFLSPPLRGVGPMALIMLGHEWQHTYIYVYTGCWTLLHRIKVMMTTCSFVLTAGSEVVAWLVLILMMSLLLDCSSDCVPTGGIASGNVLGSVCEIVRYHH
jgi:hypothetical protein